MQKYFDLLNEYLEEGKSKRWYRSQLQKWVLEVCGDRISEEEAKMLSIESIRAEADLKVMIDVFDALTDDDEVFAQMKRPLTDVKRRAIVEKVYRKVPDFYWYTFLGPLLDESLPTKRRLTDEDRAKAQRLERFYDAKKIAQAIETDPICAWCDTKNKKIWGARRWRELPAQEADTFLFCSAACLGKWQRSKEWAPAPLPEYFKEEKWKRKIEKLRKQYAEEARKKGLKRKPKRKH